MLDLDPHDADRDAWQALADGAVEPNPFFEPGFVLPAVRHLEGGEDVRLLAVDGPDGWLAAMPVLRRRLWRGVPALVDGPWTHPYAFLGAPLAVAGAPGADALRQLLEASRHRAGFVPLELLPADGPAATIAPRLGPVTVWQRYERAALHRRPQDDYEHENLSAKHRRELRRQRRLLTEEVGPVEVVEDIASVDALLELEAAGWKGEAGTAMRTAGHESLLREVCAEFDALGRLQALRLVAGDRVAAATVNLISGGAAFCFKLAFDEALARYSPGVQLELEVMRIFHRRPDLQWMDSCADPGNQMINRLWPDRRALTSLLLSGDGVLGRLGHVQGAALRTARDVNQGASS